MNDDRQIMRANGQGLLEFCDRIAERGDLNRSTARAMRSTAGKILSAEATDLASIDLRALDEEDLLKRWTQLNKADYGQGSIDTYRQRFRRARAMYLAWLDDDPNWKNGGRAALVPAKQQSGVIDLVRPRPRTLRPPKPKAQAKVSASKSSPDDSAADIGAPVGPDQSGTRLMTYDVPLRPNLVVRVTLPLDLTTDDAIRLSAFIGALAFSGEPAPEANENGRAP